MELIYFHIGFHKTGSTWLQRELFSDKSYFNLLNNFFEFKILNLTGKSKYLEKVRKDVIGYNYRYNR